MVPLFVKLVVAFFGCLGFFEAIHSFPETAAIAISIDKTAEYLAFGNAFLVIGICLVYAVLAIWGALHSLYARFIQSNIVDEAPNDSDGTESATDPERLRKYYAGVARMHNVAWAVFIFFSMQRLSGYLHDRKPATRLHPVMWNVDLLYVQNGYRYSCFILQRLLGIRELPKGAGEGPSTRASSSTIVENGVQISSESAAEKGEITEKMTLDAAYKAV